MKHVCSSLKMVLKKLDNRLRILIENGVQRKHRSMFVIVGDKGRDQVSYSIGSPNKNKSDTML